MSGLRLEKQLLLGLEYLRVEELTEETGKIVGSLRRDVVEIDAVTNHVSNWIYK